MVTRALQDNILRRGKAYYWKPNIILYMARISPTSSQKERLLSANAFRCCVCKRSGIGFNFHHIDGDSSNTIDSNLAVLCVEDHDQHHRPSEYTARSKHLELKTAELLRLKDSWEAFVTEAKKPNPAVLATLSCYGTEELIHSMQLVMQWADERIEFKKSFHLLDGNLDQLTDQIFEELASIGTNITLAFSDRPLPVEHCPCCGSGYSRTMKPAVVARLTDPAWATDSICGIYINPNQPSIALSFSLGDKDLFNGNLHLCNGTHLHYASDGIDESIFIKPKPSVRTQATRIIEHILAAWTPARVLIGTGEHENLKLISNLRLPKVWEVR
jgi:hypothetical protein